MLGVILKHNGKVGRDKTFFTDGTWTCKRLYPGGVWKGPTKFWNMKTTEESFSKESAGWVYMNEFKAIMGE